MKFQALFNPIRFFSPFPHGTCTLSIIEGYLDLEGEPPIFGRIEAPYFRIYFMDTFCTGLSPSSVRTFIFLSERSLLYKDFLYIFRPSPLSLATTHRVSFDFLSCSYLDVSVHWILDGDRDHHLFKVGYPLGDLWITASERLHIAFRF